MALYDTALEYAKSVLAPNSAAWDESGIFPLTTFRKVAEDGYSGITLPQEVGGKGLGFLESALIYEAFARGCYAFTFALKTHNNVTYLIHRLRPDMAGDVVQELVCGQKIAAFALSEPKAGSDASSIESYGLRKMDGIHVSGTKTWVTNGSEADVLAVVVRNGDSENKRDMLMVLVARNETEFVVGPNVLKMGGNLLSTPNLVFNDAVVPHGRLLSESGLQDALISIVNARIFVAAMSIGLAQEAIDKTVEYLRTRVQFGKSLIRNQGLQWNLAELSAQIEAGRWLTYRAASLLDKKQEARQEAAMAKLFCSNLAMQVTTDCVQLLGANGYSREFPLERMMRLAKIGQIADGTTQIQKTVIGKALSRF